MLKLDGITRSFNGRRALDGVSFEVGRGRLTGFVGGNGAGKTTTMRIILGVLSSDAGTVTIDGVPLDAARRQGFGYMPEERGLYPKMKVIDQLVHLARLHGFDRARATRNARDLLEGLGLTERADEPLERLSLGNQQRAQIAAALVHEPEVLVLDEPFSGLDPLAVDVVAQVLAERAAAGVPVLFSSHQLDVVERLCDDLVIIAGGTIRAAGSRERLRREHGTERYEISTGGDIGWLRGTPGVDVVEFSGGDALFGADADVAQGVLRDALSRGSVTAFGPLRPTLGEIFREVIADEADTGQLTEPASSPHDSRRTPATTTQEALR